MFLLALFSIPICISDWRYRRIPNIYLIFMLYIILATRLFLPLKSLPVISGAVACALLFSMAGMGVGDAKLFVITVLALNPSNFGVFFLLVVSMYVAAILQILLMWVKSAQLPKSIPLAFAIFSGTAFYLAAGMSTSLRQYADALVNSW